MVRQRLLLLAICLWVVALLALAALAHYQTDPPAGWDDTVFPAVAHSQALGHDPYLDTLDTEQRFLRNRAHTTPPPGSEIPCISPPCPFVYPPVTLPVVDAVLRLPAALLHPAFTLLYTLSAVAVPLALLALARPGTERKVMAMLAPGTLFFAGLVLDFVILSGNLAYLIYGVTLPLAVLGWRRQRWLPFYLAVLAASLVKLPLLTLLALPLFSSRNALRCVLLTALTGLGCFLAQAILAPQRFRHFLQVLDMHFRDHADFGVSPAGLLGSLLHTLHRSYSPWTALAYLAYAPAVLWALFHGHRRFLRGDFAPYNWLPVLLLGTLLLNPRVKEYDIAAMTLPMALVAWRLAGHGRSFWPTLLGFAAILCTAAAMVALTTMQLTYGVLLVVLFSAGLWQLQHPKGGTPATQSLPSPVEAAFV